LNRSYSCPFSSHEIGFLRFAAMAVSSLFLLRCSISALFPFSLFSNCKSPQSRKTNPGTSASFLLFFRGFVSFFFCTFPGTKNAACPFRFPLFFPRRSPFPLGHHFFSEWVYAGWTCLFLFCKRVLLPPKMFFHCKERPIFFAVFFFRTLS